LATTALDRTTSGARLLAVPADPTPATSGDRERRAHLLSTATTWGARAAWLVTAIVGGRAVGAAVADRSDAVQTVATIGSWTGWAVGALALAVPSVLALTVVRVVVPGALVVAGGAAIGGADAGAVLALVVPATVATVLVGAAETGRVWVQASAYGDEERFPLRPPLGYLIASIASWLVWTAGVVIAPLAIVGGAVIVGAVAAVVVVAGAAVLPRRWHQLSRRWLVAVPAGLVVHDPVILGETFMMTRREVAGLALTRVRPGEEHAAADLTGPTAGVAIEVTLHEAGTVLFAPRPGTPRGRAVHVRSFLVSPSRPGAVLGAARHRRLPVLGDA
jgi:hypothetical protein